MRRSPWTLFCMACNSTFHFALGHHHKVKLLLFLCSSFFWHKSFPYRSCHLGNIDCTNNTLDSYIRYGIADTTSGSVFRKSHAFSGISFCSIWSILHLLLHKCLYSSKMLLGLQTQKGSQASSKKQHLYILTGIQDSNISHSFQTQVGIWSGLVLRLFHSEVNNNSVGLFLTARLRNYLCQIFRPFLLLF